jgi:hypothetical protein
MAKQLDDWIAQIGAAMMQRDVAKLIHVLGRHSEFQFLDADGQTLTRLANQVAVWAIEGKHAGVLTAIACTGIDHMRAGLCTQTQTQGFTPAFLAADRGNDAAITELAGTGVADVLTKRSSVDLMSFSPADVAALKGRDNVIAALAETEIPAVMASLRAPNPQDQLTPMERAATHGCGGVIAALARSGNDELIAHLGLRHRAGYLAHIAASKGHASVIDALAKSGIPALQATLTYKLNSIGHTSAEMAAEGGHAGFIAALANSKFQPAIDTLSSSDSTGSGPAYLAATRGQTDVIHALADTGIEAVLARLKDLQQAKTALRYKEVADAIRDISERRSDESNLLNTLCANLEGIQNSSDAENVVADVLCPILREPFSTAGWMRPVYLKDNYGRPVPKHCISRQALEMMKKVPSELKNPFTAEKFNGFAEAQPRVKFIKHLVCLCAKTSPDATPLAREAYLKDVVEFHKSCAMLGAGSSISARQHVPQYEAVLAAAAGGARPTPRRAAEP